MLSAEHLSRWLAHLAPESVDQARYLDEVERMLRGLLDPGAADRRPGAPRRLTPPRRRAAP